MLSLKSKLQNYLWLLELLIHYTIILESYNKVCNLVFSLNYLLDGTDGLPLEIYCFICWCVSV